MKKTKHLYISLQIYKFTMAKLIRLQDETYNKLAQILTERRTKALCEGNYSKANTSFDRLVNELLAETDRNRSKIDYKQEVLGI